MWNLSKEVKESYTKYNLLPIHETDQDWETALREAKEEGEDLIGQLKGELEDVKEELLDVLPSRFIQYVENGTLNQPTLPKTVREDYLQWMRTKDKEFEEILDAAYKQTQEAVTYLPTEVQNIFEESLHDSTIQRIERTNHTLHLYINTDGGFSSKSLIHFIFQNVLDEVSDEPLQVGQWLIYNELKKTEDGFAFRVLFDCPDAEWTIKMKNLDAKYYYRPLTYTKLSDEGALDEISFAEYVAQLNRKHHYWLITPHLTCEIRSFSENIHLENGKLEFRENEFVVTNGKSSFVYQLDEYNPVHFIYTDVYEDPYGHLNEQVPTDKIEAAIFSDELELQVRAWNTLYANAEELADIINQVLSKMTITEENEMMLHAYTSHFYKEGILTEPNIKKYRIFLNS